MIHQVHHNIVVTHTMNHYLDTTPIMTMRQANEHSQTV